MERPAAEGADGRRGLTVDVNACDECGAPGAIQRCARCRATVYCHAACQRLHWRGGHDRTCRAAVGARAAGSVAGARGAPTPTRASPLRYPTPTPTSTPAHTPASAQAGAVHTDNAARECGGGGGGEGDAEPVNPCPLCICNEDDSGDDFGACYACGQMYCGECNAAGVVGAVGGRCPTCRAPFGVSHTEETKRLWSLVHDRSPGRHTPVAQNHLGVMFSEGRGTTQDQAEAVQWYRKAAEQEYAPAQLNLGCMYSKGTGVEQDCAKACLWYRKAAEKGFATAQHSLGTMYSEGKGVAHDHVEAARWYCKAAEQGYNDAQFNLGFMYAKGRGVE